LDSPVVLLKRAPAPIAVFCSAVVFKASVAAPSAVLRLPVVLFSSEKKPTPVLNVPLLSASSAACPSAVLPPGYPPSGGGTTACAGCKSAKPVSRETRIKESVFVFIYADCASFALNGNAKMIKDGDPFSPSTSLPMRHDRGLVKFRREL